jgi:tRNA-modifying protein YgfZ
MTGYQALRENAAWADASSRGRIRVTGEDRKRLLHAMTTNQVQELAPGEFCYAFFLNAQGRILADVYVICAEDHLLLDLEPEVREKIYAHLDRFIIADDVTLEDVTGATGEIILAGPKAADLVSSLGLTPSFRVRDAHHLIVSLADKGGLTARLEAAGVQPATAEEMRLVRIESGVPRYGEDISESNLVQETQLAEALNFAKGCYLGQEIVERVRSRGHVNKLLVSLSLPGPEAPQRGARLMAADKEAGEVTSAVWSPAEGRVRAFAYVRTDYLKPGVALQLRGAPAQVVQQR